MKKSTDDITWHMVMPNATELSEAGVSFAKVSFINKNKDNIGDMTNLLDIKFEKGLMEIPCFRVKDDTETVLRNLIAYEQQSFDVHPTYFSDYTTFMNHLIDSDKDVNLLRQKGIIVNWIGEDKDVASLFNKIGNGVTTYSDFYYKEEFRKAAEHCQKPWNKMKANLKHNYFSSPWVGASTVGAIILLILTTIQTILAITSAVKNDKQVANIFKKLSDGVAITDFYYIKECSKLIQHCEKPWSQMKASLKHNYFQSPWARASTVAAITLLVLTAIQIVLAFTGYVNKSSLL
ncbi:hypothetical protein MTR67_016558 [Solanum verrucosum]|uniref:Uncharacterized protein n=1 Tax=Solanum verrucosum TaxID=315347 RepID=A0AAF0QHF7_SOLVR|nr:hypothetical protein MTR67_016558 [Solanum verrucosum]